MSIFNYSEKASGIEKLEKKISKKSPYSKKSFETSELNSEINNEIEKSFSDLNIFLENISPYVEITGDFRKSLKKNFSSFFGESFYEKNQKIFLEIFKNKEVQEKIFILENLLPSDFEKKSEFLGFLSKEIINSKKFDKIIKNELKNSDDVLKILDEIENILREWKDDPDLDYNISGSPSGKKVGFLDKNVYSQIWFYKIAFLGGMFTYQNPGDIATYIKFISPDADLAHGWFNNFSTISENIEKGFASNIDVLIGSIPGIADVSLKVLMATFFLKQLSNVSKRTSSDILKTGLVGLTIFSAMSVGNIITGGGAGISAAMNGMANDEKAKHLDSWFRGAENSNLKVKGDIYKDGEVKINSINGNIIISTSDKIKKAVDYAKEFNNIHSNIGNALSEEYELFNQNGYEEILKLLNKDIISEKVNDKGILGDFYSYSEQVNKISNELNNIYKNIFDNILIDIRGESANGNRGLGDDSYAKISVLFSAAGYNNKGEDFNDQLRIFIDDVYGLKTEEGLKVYSEVLEGVNYLKEKFGKEDYKKTNLQSLNGVFSEIKNGFINENNSKINEYIQNVKNLFLEIEDKGIENVKLSDFNLIGKKFNNEYIDGFFKDSVSDFKGNVEDVKKDIEEVLKTIDKNSEVIDESTGKVREYKKIQIDDFSINTEVKASEIEEVKIDLDNIISYLNSSLDYFEKTGELDQTLVDFYRTINWSVGLSYGDIGLLFVVAMLFQYFGRREITVELPDKNHKEGFIKKQKVVSIKDFLINMDEKNKKYLERIKEKIEKIGEILDEKNKEIKHKKISIENIKNASEFNSDFEMKLRKNKFHCAKVSKDENGEKAYTFSEEHVFGNGKLFEVNINDFLISNNEKKVLNNNDIIFIPEYEENPEFNNLGIKNNEGNFEIFLNGNNDCNHILDFKSESFKEKTSLDYLKTSGNILGKTYKIGIMISKDGFIIIPYKKEGKLNIENNDNLEKLFIK